MMIMIRDIKSSLVKLIFAKLILYIWYQYRLLPFKLYIAIIRYSTGFDTCITFKDWFMLDIVDFILFVLIIYYILYLCKQVS
jgi:hypothetical protein